MNAIGYVRSATGGPGALERQRREIEEHCKSKGWNLAALYGDSGKSGLDPNRKGLLGALNALSEGRGDVLLATSPDRLSRSMKDLVELNRQLKDTDSELALVYASRNVLDTLSVN